MRFILAAAAKDVRRHLSDPAALAVWIGIPILLSGLLHLISGGADGPAPRATVLVVDQDQTLISRLVINGGRQGQLAERIDLQLVSLAEGQRRMDDGDATAMIVLPKGLQTAVIRDTAAQITLVTNPSERILPGIVEEALEIVVEGAFYAQQLLGAPMRRIADSASSTGPSDSDVASIAVEINQRIAGLQSVLLPPVLSLEVKTEQPQSQPDLNFGQLFMPGMLFMSFLFIAMGLSADIWREKVNGTLRRALTTPQSAARLIVGKLAAGMAVMSAVALVGLAAAVILFDLTWSRVPGAFLWSIFAGGALLAILTLLQTLATSARTADMLAGMITFPLMMMGGSFFPFEAMPAWMAAAGQWTPNGLAVVRLKELMYGDPSAASMAAGVLALGAPALAALALASRRLTGRFAIS